MNKNSGYTLLEISIVMVILGLIVGGVVAGASLIRNAELGKVVQEFQNYQSAVRLFHQKYNDLPGDFPHAEDIWGAASSCPNGTPSGTLTCNGNNDGKLQEPSAGNRYAEVFTFWQHLANADLIKGKFTGKSGPNHIVDVELGVNAPPSDFDGAGWSVRYCLSGGCGGDDYAIDYFNHYTFGSDKATYDTDAAILTPGEAYGIDLKIDDGHPAKGNVVAIFYQNKCSAADDGSSSSSDLNAHYRTEDSSAQCALVFRNAF